ncbi:MAG: hypothetical protein AAFW59_03255 [Pseudomonadota bacterium]
MIRISRHAQVIATTFAGLIAFQSLSCTTASAQSQEATQAPRSGFTLELKQGQVLQLVVPEESEEGSAARQTYYQNAFPIAERLGYQNEGMLTVRQKVRSDYDPNVFVFFSWPDAEAVRGYRSNPRFAEFKELRREAWRELKIYDAEIRDDLKLTFDPAKHYSALFAWLDPETRSDYTSYLEGIEPAVTRAGGRFIYKMYDPYMQALNEPSDGPGQITFVEWETEDGFAKVQQSPEYREHQSQFASSVQKFEFYWLQTRR